MTIKEILNKIHLGNLHIEVKPEEYIYNGEKLFITYYIKVRLIYNHNEVYLSGLTNDKKEISKIKQNLIKEAYELCSLGMEEEDGI